MKAPVIVWRESVYKNGFKCSCGYPLMAEGKIDRKVLYNPHEKILICPECQKVVAMLKGEMDVDDNAEGMQMKGKWMES